MTARKDSRRGPVDWAAIRRQLDTATENLQREFAPSSDKRRAILHARALALAAEPPEEIAPQDEIELLEFGLAHERYALETRWVEEVHALKELTPLPCTPAFVCGIANIRGRIISVIDIKKFFDLPQRGLTDLNKAIILSGGGMKFGVLADTIHGVRRIAIAHIQAPPPTLTGIRVDYLRGVTAERLVVLDARSLLADRSLLVDQEVS